MSAGRIAICDVGLGNLRSVERAVLAAAERAGAAQIRVEVTAEPERIRGADKVVMPGQGGFRDCARALDAGIGSAVKESIARGAPYLGICLGLQVLFERSEEAPGCAGLALFEGEVARLEAKNDLKVPHIGWNVVEPRVDGSLVPREPSHFYFVHSYVVVPKDARVIAATSDYGGPFVCAIAKDNVFACQFHPEKSQRVGLALLERFVRS